MFEADVLGGTGVVVSSSVVTVTPDAWAFPAIYTREMGKLFAYRGVLAAAGLCQRPDRNSLNPWLIVALSPSKISRHWFGFNLNPTCAFRAGRFIVDWFAWCNTLSGMLNTNGSSGQIEMATAIMFWSQLATCFQMWKINRIGEGFSMGPLPYYSEMALLAEMFVASMESWHNTNNMNVH